MGAKSSVTQPTVPAEMPPPATRRGGATAKGDRTRLQSLSPHERFNGKEGRTGHTPVPHSYFTILPRKCLGGTGAQHFAVGYIMDRTFGAPGNPGWVRINCVVLARLTGLSARAFTLVLEDAATVGIVKRRRPGCADCEEGQCDCPGKEWEYKTYPEDWASLPDREKMAAEPAAAEPAAAEPDSPAVERLIRAGATAKQFALSVQLKEVAAPVEMRFQPTNRSGHDLLISYTVSGDGTIREFVDAVPERRKKSEAGGSALPLEIITAETKELTSAYPLAAYRTYFAPIFVDELRKPLDEPFLKRIAAAAQYAPVDDFDTPVQNLRKRKLLTSGMILEKAKEVGAAWAGRRKEVEAADAKRAAELAEKERGQPMLDFARERSGESLHQFWLITGNDKAKRKNYSSTEADLAEWGAAIEEAKREFQARQNGAAHA
ncbi:MAG TPA: hypothetical protein VHY84_19330 [Bryobacteraceae bacterium]|nr:hypothetical protein [Bryobacteraceae bacterium]